MLSKTELSTGIDLWQCDLDLVVADTALLSPAEAARAARLRIPLVRQRFVAARHALRTVLAAYVAEAPAALRIAYTAAGKPFLADHPQISFNLAHAQQLLLIAVTQQVRIGVDVEQIADADYAGIAQHFFAPSEQHALAALPEAQRRAAFYRIWTCKEAFVKAHGAGLALGLDRFAVSIDPAQTTALLHITTDPQAAQRWRIVSFRPAEGFVAAVCVERTDAPHCDVIAAAEAGR
jgi:4'-phosphopantetheinyl transferase